MIYTQTTELYHHGVKGQKWGVRRFQNEDGTLTEAGKAKYGVDSNGNIVNKDLYKKDRIKMATKDARKSFFKNNASGQDIMTYNKKDKNGNDVTVKTNKFKYDLVEKYGQEIADKAEDRSTKQIVSLGTSICAALLLAPVAYSAIAYKKYN